MKIVGEKSVARGLQRALGIVNVALLVVGGFLALTTLMVWLAPGFNHGLGGTMKDGSTLTDHQVLSKERILLTGTLFTVGLTWLVNDRLRKLLGAVNVGHAFQLANVDYLRTIGFALLGSQLVALVQRLATQQVVGFGTADAGLGLGLDLKAYVAVAVIFVLAEVFRQGTQLQDDAAMTV